MYLRVFRRLPSALSSIIVVIHVFIPYKYLVQFFHLSLTIFHMETSMSLSYDGPSFFLSFFLEILIALFQHYISKVDIVSLGLQNCPRFIPVQYYTKVLIRIILVSKLIAFVLQKFFFLQKACFAYTVYIGNNNMDPIV